MMKLQDMKVLVTGATGGIGKPLVRQLAQAGASVIAHGRSESALMKLAESDGSAITTVSGDFREQATRSRLEEAARKANINVLINLAGINDFGLFEESPIESIMEINVIAPMLLTQALLPDLETLAEAVILNVGSTFGHIGYPGYVAYCSSKHAIKGFSEALRRELADTNIDVLYVSPRATRTTMNSPRADAANQALGTKSDTPEAVARSIIDSLARRRARHQLGAQEKLQVAVNAMFPRVVDNAVGNQLKLIKSFALKEEMPS